MAYLYIPECSESVDGALYNARTRDGQSSTNLQYQHKCTGFYFPEQGRLEIFELLKTLAHNQLRRSQGRVLTGPNHSLSLDLVGCASIEARIEVLTSNHCLPKTLKNGRTKYTSMLFSAKNSQHLIFG